MFLVPFDIGIHKIQLCIENLPNSRDFKKADHTSIHNFLQVRSDTDYEVNRGNMLVENSNHFCNYWCQVSG